MYIISDRMLAWNIQGPALDPQTLERERQRQTDRETQRQRQRPRQCEEKELHMFFNIEYLVSKLVFWHILPNTYLLMIKIKNYKLAIYTYVYILNRLICVYMTYIYLIKFVSYY